jgi:hypothetical protein
MFFLLFVPENIYAKVAASDPTFSEMDHPQSSFIIPSPSCPSSFEAECIRHLADSRHGPIVKSLFTRLLPYLNGKSHLEEIIFEENLSRKELKLVMSSYREEIVTSLHG